MWPQAQIDRQELLYLLHASPRKKGNSKSFLYVFFFIRIIVLSTFYVKVIHIIVEETSMLMNNSTKNSPFSWGYRRGKSIAKFTYTFFAGKGNHTSREKYALCWVLAKKSKKKWKKFFIKCNKAKKWGEGESFRPPMIEYFRKTLLLFDHLKQTTFWQGPTIHYSHVKKKYQDVLWAWLCTSIFSILDDRYVVASSIAAIWNCKKGHPMRMNVRHYDLYWRQFSQVFPPNVE